VLLSEGQTEGGAVGYQQQGVKGYGARPENPIAGMALRPSEEGREAARYVRESLPTRCRRKPRWTHAKGKKKIGGTMRPLRGKVTQL